ncbi:MAG: efflux RND transporter periplasmic adaptor subunit [Myxococcota bacterium]
MKRTVVLAVLMSACAAKETPPEVKPRPVLSVIARESFGRNQAFPGAMAPRYITQLAFRVGGRITKRLVAVGDVVKKGDVIATLDAAALASSAAAARASVDAVAARQRNAAQTLDRETRLLEVDAIPQSAMDTAQTSHDTASASVAEASARLAKARESLGYGTLRAELDGVITKIDFEVEQTVAPNQVVAEMARPEVVDVVVDVPESVASSLAIGDDAIVSAADDANVSSHGVIRQMNPAADRLSRTHRVWIALPERLPGVRLGATMYATFAQDFPAAVRVPVEAVFDKDGSEFVWIVDADAVHLRGVKCVDRKGKRAVISEGVRDGERVVVAGVHQLVEGQRIAPEVAP